MKEEKPPTPRSSSVDVKRIIQNLNKFGAIFKDCSSIDEEEETVSLARNDVGILLEILKDSKSEKLKGIKPLMLAKLMNSTAWWPNKEELRNIHVMIGRILIEKWESKEIGTRDCIVAATTDLAEGFGKLHYNHEKTPELRNAVGIIARIISIAFWKDKLNRYTLEQLSVICNTFGLFVSKNEMQAPIEFALSNISKKVIMLQESNELNDTSGELLFPILKTFNVWLKKTNRHLLMPAIVCIAKYFTKKFNEDKLEALSAKSLCNLSRHFILRLNDDDKEGSLKLVIISLAKAIHSLSIDALCEFHSKDLVGLIQNSQQCLEIIKEENLLKPLIMKIAEAINTQIDLNKSRLADCSDYVLHRLANSSTKLPKQVGNDILKPTMLTVAKIIIQKHEVNRLKDMEINGLGYLAIEFSKWHDTEDPNNFDIMSKAILSISRALITQLKLARGRLNTTVKYTNLVEAFGIWKEIDDKQSLRYSIEGISLVLVEQYQFVQLKQYSLQELCVVTNGFVKWYDELPSLKIILIIIAENINSNQIDLLMLTADELSTLAQNLIYCYKSDDKDTVMFKIVLYVIASKVVEIYNTNELEEYNVCQLSCLANTFCNLFGDDDSKNSIKFAIIVIAKKFRTFKYSENDVVFQDLLTYLHIFANAFRLWYNDEENVLHSGLICIEEIISMYVNRTDMNSLTLYQLSILSKAFAKLAKDDRKHNNGCLAIAKLIIENEVHLLGLTSIYLEYLVKTFSLWFDDVESSFLGATEALARTVSRQLLDENYAIHYNIKILADLAFSFSKWDKETGEQYTKEAIIAISTFINRYYNRIIEMSSLELQYMARMCKAYLNCTENPSVIFSIFDISLAVNVLGRTIQCDDREYLPYFIETFSKVFTTLDQVKLRLLILASSHIIKAHTTEDLKKYDRKFLTYLDEYFSKFSDDWDIHESLLIIRQELGITEVINGRTLLEIFQFARSNGVEELREMMLSDPGTLSTLAVTCSSFLHCDDQSKTLRCVIIKIADVVCSVPEVTIIKFDREWLANLFEAFTKCFEDTAVQKAMYVLAKIIREYGTEEIGIFHYTLVEKITRSLRKWCDYFPSSTMTEFDYALHYVTRRLKIFRERKSSEH